MDQNMMALTTNIKISKQRLEEIFAVPETKELYERLVSEQRNKECIEECKLRLSKLYQKAEIDDMILIDEINNILRIFILSEALQYVVNGKTLNNAIQQEIKKQFKDPRVFKNLNDKINALELKHRFTEFLLDCLK